MENFGVVIDRDQEFRWDTNHPKQEDGFNCGPLCLAELRRLLQRSIDFFPTNLEKILQLRENFKTMVVRYYCSNPCRFCQKPVKIMDWVLCDMCGWPVHSDCPKALVRSRCRYCNVLRYYADKKTKEQRVYNYLYYTLFN